MTVDSTSAMVETGAMKEQQQQQQEMTSESGGNVVEGGEGQIQQKKEEEGYRARYVDIGINLTDPVYRGIYHSKRGHDDDFEHVLKRAKEVGCVKMVITGSDLKNSREAIELAGKYPGFLYATIGIHPCNSKDFTKHPNSKSHILTSLESLATSPSTSSHIVAFGEIGLDYDRLFLSPKDIQVTSFASQLELASKLNLPLFLHSRAAHADFVRLLKVQLDQGHLKKRGVVHSFTGTLSEMQELVALGFDIGINGCSMKTSENVDVVRAVPLERLQIETDGPWCEIRPSHAASEYLKDYDGPEERVGGGSDGEGKGWKMVRKEKWREGALVKGRNEPCFIGRVAWAVARIKGVEVREVVDAAWGNSCRMFGLEEER